MHTIIAGGRTYQLTWVDFLYLRGLPISRVISGGARGADAGGEDFAVWRNIHIHRFPAEWEKYGRGAGMRRNKEMAVYAEAVVLFPGGAGTANMRKEAKKQGLLIFDPPVY